MYTIIITSIIACDETGTRPGVLHLCSPVIIRLRNSTGRKVASKI